MCYRLWQILATVELIDINRLQIFMRSQIFISHNQRNKYKYNLNKM